jgi:glycosyltransferase involved in cell wall biosynthesis
MKVSIIIPSIDGDRDGLTQQAVRSCQYQEGFTLGVDYEVILSQADEFVGVNINNGVKKAKGKYIKIVGDDDILMPNCLKDLYEKAEEGYDFVCSNAINFGIDEDYIVFSEIPLTVSELASHNSFHGGTLLYRKETMPLFDEDMWTAEEYEHTLRMAAAGLSFGYVDKVVYRYRMHGEQKSGVYWGDDRRSKSKKQARYDYITEMQCRFINNHERINTIPVNHR